MDVSGLDRFDRGFHPAIEGGACEPVDDGRAAASEIWERQNSPNGQLDISRVARYRRQEKAL